MKSESDLLMPFKVSRSFLHQFTGQTETVTLVDFDEIGSGSISKDAAIVSAPTYIRNKMGYEFHAFERVLLHKDPVTNKSSMAVTWTDERKRIVHSINFIEDGSVIPGRPFSFNGESPLILPNKYIVKAVHCEFNKEAIWGICEFETLIPVVRKGVICDEVFSQAYFEIDAEVLAFDSV